MHQCTCLECEHLAVAAASPPNPSGCFCFLPVLVPAQRCPPPPAPTSYLLPLTPSETSHHHSPILTCARATLVVQVPPLPSLIYYRRSSSTIPSYQQSSNLLLAPLTLCRRGIVSPASDTSARTPPRCRRARPPQHALQRVSRSSGSAVSLWLR